MDGGKQSGSSFTSDLFGSKDSSASSSSGIFDSIFAPSAQVSSQAFLRPLESEKKHDSGNTVWSANTGVIGNNTRSSEVQTKSIPSKDPSLGYQEEKVQPFHYSSSIYYGGQDVYSRPQNTQSPGLTFGKDGEEDDSGSASRGNWWQGSLYY
ncbi:Encodes a protein involved in salt tolerance [Forsythia ovata]|uniref:Encodes a protein involved in salt tolerance n=1 Tax=Forsythia ovata TaxID=205694 RepID=A0ABD1WYJ2_9LAMI